MIVQRLITRDRTNFLWHCFLVFVVSLTYAEKHYIDPINGNDTYNGSSESQAWKTIGKANQTLVAGDTVFIKAGTYKAIISPKNSGTAAQPITYMNFGSDTVVFSDTIYGIYLDAKSYILIQGITMKQQDRFVYIRNTINAEHGRPAALGLYRAGIYIKVDEHGNKRVVKKFTMIGE